MKSTADPLQRALQATSREELATHLINQHAPLSLPDIQRLTQQLAELGESNVPLRLAILHTYTSEPLDPYLTFEAMLQGCEPMLYHGPYGAIVQEARSGTGLCAHKPDLTVLLLRLEDIEPKVAEPLHALTPTQQEALAQTVRGSVSAQLETLRRAVAGHLLVTFLPPITGPGLGDYDVNAANSEQAWRARLKADLSSDLRERFPATTLLDLDESLAAIGRERFFDLRWWYTSRFPFSSPAAQHIARRVITVGIVLKRPRAKVIALDADNTLWRGVVGEEGFDGIGLGPDYPGNVYMAFQRRLLDYQQRGFILALCSKNNEADVLEVLSRHPHQILREEHFAAMRVNWKSKPQNLQSLAEELNLALDAFVVVDDSAHECLAIRHTLPEVEVVQLPSRTVDIPTCLDRVARLQVISLTDEDQKKTELYVHERKRRDLAAASENVGTYLRSLQMDMLVSFDDPRQAPRVAQLTQKTNQFNLTTRRYTEEEIVRFARADDWIVAHFLLRDIFGDSGIVGVGIAHLVSPEVSELDTFLMSCRVIGRSAETAFLEAILAALQQRGVRTLVGDYVPTAKNKLVAAFLPDHRFAIRDDGRYERSLDGFVPACVETVPITVRVATGASVLTV